MVAGPLLTAGLIRLLALAALGIGLGGHGGGIVACNGQSRLPTTKRLGRAFASDTKGGAIKGSLPAMPRRVAATRSYQTISMP